MLKTDQITINFMFKLRINWYEMIAEKQLRPPGTLKPFKKLMCDVTRIVAIIEEGCLDKLAVKRSPDNQELNQQQVCLHPWLTSFLGYAIY